MVNWKLLQNTLLSQYDENQKVQGHFHCQLQFLLVRGKYFKLYSLFSIVPSFFLAFSYFVPLGVDLCLFQPVGCVAFLILLFYQLRNILLSIQ